MRVCFHVKKPWSFDLCVYLEISVNTHLKIVLHTTLIYSSTFSLITTPTNEMCHEISPHHTKFCSPNKLLREISLFSERNFWRNFVVCGTKCHAKFRTFARNLNDMGTISALKYRRKFTLFEISDNFREIRQNLLSLLFHSTVYGGKKF